MRDIFFSNATPTTEIYTLSLHDALPISVPCAQCCRRAGRDRRGCLYRLDLSALLADSRRGGGAGSVPMGPGPRDRKSTRLNSSHPSISYAVFCLKKKKTPSPYPRSHTST